MFTLKRIENNEQTKTRNGSNSQDNHNRGDEMHC